MKRAKWKVLELKNTIVEIENSNDPVRSLSCSYLKIIDQLILKKYIECNTKRWKWLRQVERYEK